MCGLFIVSAACPANCIYIEAAENTESQRISAGERYASVYNIDYSRCIFCGYCVEACPTDAITHGHGFELAPYNINALIYRKEQLWNRRDCRGAAPPLLPENPARTVFVPRCRSLIRLDTALELPNFHRMSQQS